MVDNTHCLVREHRFASAEECKQLASALLEQSRRTHSIPEISRLGISQYQQGLRGSKAAYFAEAREVSVNLDTLFNLSFDPVQRVQERLREFNLDIATMAETDYGLYAPCAGKLRNGSSPIHVDFAPQDSFGWDVGSTEAQLAWNIYLDVADNEGDLVLWDKQWQPEDEKFLVKDQYYFDPAVVAEVDPLRVKVNVGDLILVNSRNFHAVSESTNRLTVGGFISFFADGKVRFWI